MSNSQQLDVLIKLVGLKKYEKSNRKLEDMLLHRIQTNFNTLR